MGLETSGVSAYPVKSAPTAGEHESRDLTGGQTDEVRQQVCRLIKADTGREEGGKVVTCFASALATAALAGIGSPAHHETRGSHEPSATGAMMTERTRAEPGYPDSAQRVIPFPSAPVVPQVTFDRAELRILFGLYGRRVAEGEWRDYALDFRRDKAVFSIYRRTSEMPLYRVEKDPKLARRQGAYAVVAATGLVLKRGQDLARVLAVLEKPLRVV